jgi:hypothetical protein
MPTILLKKSDTPSAVPTGSDLTNLAGGVEVAVNTADGRMFAMNSSSAVVELGINPTSLSIANNASINVLTATTATITTLNGTSATITTILDGAGNVRNIPSVGAAKTAEYTLAVTDIGEYVTVGASGAITIPNDVFAAGNAVSVYNDTSGNITITCTITTAYLAGTDTDQASLTLATRGIATVLFTSPSACVVAGNVSA